jgi:hypothetical protein
MPDDARPLGFYGVRSGQTIHVIDTDPFSLARGGGLDDVSQVWRVWLGYFESSLRRTGLLPHGIPCHHPVLRIPPLPVPLLTSLHMALFVMVRAVSSPVCQIEKYRMTEEDYDKRAGTLRAFKREQLAKDPTFKFFPKPKAAEGADEEAKPDVESEACIEGITVGSRCEVQPGGRRGTVAFVGHVPQIAPGYWVRLHPWHCMRGSTAPVSVRSSWGHCRVTVASINGAIVWSLVSLDARACVYAMRGNATAHCGCWSRLAFDWMSRWARVTARLAESSTSSARHGVARSLDHTTSPWATSPSWTYSRRTTRTPKPAAVEAVAMRRAAAKPQQVTPPVTTRFRPVLLNRLFA